MMKCSQRLLWVVLLCLANAAAASQWQVQKDASRLGFVATWEGTPFEGVFHRWDADLRFDPGAPQSGQFDVRVDVTSVDTDSADRDEGMGEPEWFDFATYPAASFHSTGFERQGDGRFLVRGRLTIKGVSRDIELPFRWEADGVRVRLRAQAQLTRTDFNLGEGEWASGDEIGLDVRVHADLVLVPNG